MYDIPIKQKKSTKLTLKEEENRLELIKKENVDKIHDILINSKNLYEDLIILYPNLKGNKHLMMARTINDLYRNKSLQNILFGEEFDSIIDLKNNLFIENEQNNILNSYIDIIGVQDDGTRSSNGAGLRQVMFNNSKLDLTTKDTAYFDNHRSYRFSDYYDTTGNVFVKIPISYWWRGMLPDVVDGTTPRWTMLLSPYPITKTINGVSCTFTASPDTFNHNTKGWLPHFYIGKYRGSNDGTGTKVASKQGAAHWGNVSFDNCITYCSNNGTNYHMLSLFEWHEILGRMVIEKATFQLMPESIRATQASCVYRGINDFCYGPPTGIYVEWMDGIRTDANGKYEMWNQAQGSYISTNNNCFEYTTDELTRYAQSIYNNMDNLFISDIGGPNSTCMIPNLAGMRSIGYISRVCYVNFRSSVVYDGAFNTYFNYSSSITYAFISCRLAKY